MNQLPSLEEFIKSNKTVTDEMKEVWDEDLFRCPQCNSGMKRDYSYVYMTNPPKYRYFCRDCGCSIVI